MVFLIFLFSTCRMFRVFSGGLIPSFTRCRHVERFLTINSQLSMPMAADFISLLQTTLKRRIGQPVLRVSFSSTPVRRSFEILPFSILHMCPNHLRRLWLSRGCMLEHLAFSSTVVLGILSCQVIPRIRLRKRRSNEFNYASCLARVTMFHFHKGVCWLHMHDIL